jgi:GSH-dependent disulfide-bond oxidoreductase
MIDVYYWPTINGRKITIALEEMRLPYNIIPVNPKSGETSSSDFLRVNPNGKIPAIVDHCAAPERIVVFESAAILQYLADKSGKLMPADLAGRYAVIQWLTFQAANVGPMMGQFAHFHDYAREKIQYALNRYGRETERLYRVIEKRLHESQYIAGDSFSIADVSLWPWIAPARQEQSWHDWPSIKSWHDRIAVRPGVMKGNAVRLDLQPIGVQDLTDKQWNSLYGWQQAPRN